MNCIFTTGWPRAFRTIIVTVLLAAFSFQSSSMVVAQTAPATPGWWAERGALAIGSVPDDYAVINQGQIKNLARAARDEMNAKLPGGAGAGINALVNAWTTTHTLSDDYAVVTTGQLKALAAPFYDRLTAAGLATGYPWNQAGAVADNYAAANIGQAKNLFSFVIPALSNVDTDGDGLTNLQESEYGTLTDTWDSDGDGISDGQEIAEGTDPTSIASNNRLVGLKVYTRLQ